MSNLVLSRADLWPVGTNVKACAGPPVGEPILTGVVTETAAVQSDGTVTFTTLVDGARYTIGAVVSGLTRRTSVIKGSTYNGH